MVIFDLRNTLESPDFLKIDVEGHEEAALRGAHDTILQDQPLLLMECNHRDHPCVRPLADFGYTVIDADNLTVERGPGSTNFLCVPQRFTPWIARVLERAPAQE